MARRSGWRIDETRAGASRAMERRRGRDGVDRYEVFCNLNGTYPTQPATRLYSSVALDKENIPFGHVRTNPKAIRHDSR